MVLVGGMTRMPKVVDTVKEFSRSRAAQGVVNPDEVVALGAAIQGGVLQGDVKDVLLLDVTLLTLGIETLGGVFTLPIERNTTIRPRRARPSPPLNIQPERGDDPGLPGRAADGARQQDAGPVRPGRHSATSRAVCRKSRSHYIDANGNVNVGAKEKATSKDQSIPKHANGGLSDPDIERMVKEAEANAADDKLRKEQVEAKNHGDALIHSTEKAMAEHGDKVGAADKAAIETAIAELKTALEGDDASSIQAKTQALMQVSMKLGEAMAKASAGGEGAEASSESPAEEGVVDAEFEEVSDDKQA